VCSCNERLQAFGVVTDPHSDFEIPVVQTNPYVLRQTPTTTTHPPCHPQTEHQAIHYNAHRQSHFHGAFERQRRKVRNQFLVHVKSSSWFAQVDSPQKDPLYRPRRQARMFLLPRRRNLASSSVKRLWECAERTTRKESGIDGAQRRFVLPH
jgi:CRISPR/Cas system endoribonuclease Cas6 (RAMP superfamily)